MPIPTTPWRGFPARLRALKPKAIPAYIWCSAFTSLGGFLWGYDTGSIGPITVMPQFEERFGKISPGVQGVLVSSILITASFSSFFSGPLSQRISRTFTISLGALLFAIGRAVAASGMTLAQFFVGRALAGLGEGVFMSSITVYVMEISPPTSRGRLATLVHVYYIVGITLGFFTCYGSVNIASSASWRLPVIVQSVVAITLAVGTPFCPHSPRWLRHAGRVAEIERACIRLGAVEYEPSSDDLQERPAFKAQIRQLWAKDLRMRTIFCVVMMSLQQLSGIDAVLYYAPIVFAQAGLSSNQATFLASGASGILMVVVASISSLFQDRLSRRSQMIGGSALCALCMGVIGLIYATNTNGTDSGKHAIMAFIYLFIAAYVSTWAIVARLVCGEIQPSHTRAAASSLGQAANWITNCLVAMTTPLFLEHTPSGAYFMFGGCSLLNAAICLVFQPETKGLSLEEIDSGGLEEPALRKVFGTMRSRMRRRAREGAQVPMDVIIPMGHTAASGVDI
ncbi:general substrate transporter [Cylindrobasidium torrendii FP15055 ss-10]|uniref:General substrate transporter n=1 Tax=Cylindrobasidium torrendii FP15055 ss-10 TaxID=1314674 RepID=A0A0D7B6A7_9AGAR|nr:general substrate transporter [Cylindrobasidium torrendii FP15055 ss-10]